MPPNLTTARHPRIRDLARDLLAELSSADFGDGGPDSDWETWGPVGALIETEMGTHPDFVEGLRGIDVLQRSLEALADLAAIDSRSRMEARETGLKDAEEALRARYKVAFTAAKDAGWGDRAAQRLDGLWEAVKVVHGLRRTPA